MIASDFEWSFPTLSSFELHIFQNWRKNFKIVLFRVSKKSSGRSSRTSKYTKTFEEPEEETVIAPAIDYDTDIEEAQEKEINEYDTAATGNNIGVVLV